MSAWKKEEEKWPEFSYVFPTPAGKEPVYGIFDSETYCQDGNIAFTGGPVKYGATGDTDLRPWKSKDGTTCADMRTGNTGHWSEEDAYGNVAGDICCQFCPYAIFPAPKNWPTQYKCRAELACLETTSRGECEACTQTWWDEGKQMCMETCQRTNMGTTPDDVGRIMGGPRCDYGHETPWC